jgi:mRNA-degrading endonuclease HigB of HigAB toxin-antitoxin module
LPIFVDRGAPNLAYIDTMKWSFAWGFMGMAWHCRGAPENVKASYPKASILKASRVVFNIKVNDYRLAAALQYRAGALAIRFFGTHADYDNIDAETV